MSGQKPSRAASGPRRAPRIGRQAARAACFAPLLGVLLAAAPALAADAEGEFAIKGAGLQSCEKLTAAWDERSADLPLYLGWIDGYLTGMNQHFADTFDMAPWQSVTTLLGLTREYCRDAPGETRVIDAFNALMQDFAPSRLTEKSDGSAIRRGDTAVVLYAATVAALERRLAEKGFDPGTADGDFTDRTAAALADFQTARGLEPTGLPDQQTLFALFVHTGD